MNIPNTKRIPNIISNIAIGAKSNPVAQLIRPELAPEKASYEEKVAEPNIISSAMTVTRSAPSTDAIMLLMVNLR